jgi:hypothetical protein
VLGNKNGPLGVRTPRELKGTIKAGKGGNKTQVIVLHVIKRLLKPLKSLKYHVFLNNLFISIRIVKYTRF